MVSASGMSVPLSAIFDFSGRKRFAVNTLVFGLSPLPGPTGTYKKTRTGASFKAPFSVVSGTGRVAGNVSVTQQGRKFRFVYRVFVDGSPDIFSFKFSGNRKR